MLSMLFAAALLIQAPAAPAEEHVLETAMFERPADVAPAAFLEQLIAAAGASSWQRSIQDSVQDGFAFRITGLRAEQNAVAFFTRAAEAEGQPGRVCRIRLLRAAPPSSGEISRAMGTCLTGIGMPAPIITAPISRLPPPAQRR